MDQVRILIAEDNELVALTLEEQIVSLGFAVAGVARNGREAVQMCEQLTPDVVLMDMQMPEMAGDVAARQITQRCPRPIIMLTAFSDPDHIHRAEAAGALAYLVKPINPEELPATVDIALARFRELDNLRNQVTVLQDTIDGRKLVERAVGIWMKRLSIGHDEASARMEKRAAERNVSLKEIAQAIVDAESLLS
jgi:AmiR/NasT family two-component response regulator